MRLVLGMNKYGRWVFLAPRVLLAPRRPALPTGFEVHVHTSQEPVAQPQCILPAATVLGAASRYIYATIQQLPTTHHANIVCSGNEQRCVLWSMIILFLKLDKYGEYVVDQPPALELKLSAFY